MGYHILMTSKDTYEICIERGIYGASTILESPKKDQFNADIVASLSCIKKDDYVFFYVRQAGIVGLWQVSLGPFLDSTKLWTDNEQMYPYRVCFDPIVREFPNHIDMNDIYDLMDNGKIWTFDLGANIKKNHWPISSREGEEIIRLLLRNNPIFSKVKAIKRPYFPNDVFPILNKIDFDKKGLVKYEGFLNAYITRELSRGNLKEMIGEYDDFLNYVPTSYNKVMDIFLTHVTKVGSINITHKYTCMELKKDVVEEEDLKQIIRYEKWLSRKLADGDTDMIQSILVGHEFDSKVLEYCAKRKAIDEKLIRLFEYKSEPESNIIHFKEIDQ